MKKLCDLASELAMVVECLLVGAVAVIGILLASYVYVRAFEVIFAFAVAATSLAP